MAEKVKRESTTKINTIIMIEEACFLDRGKIRTALLSQHDISNIIDLVRCKKLKINVKPTFPSILKVESIMVQMSRYLIEMAHSYRAEIIKAKSWKL